MQLNLITIVAIIFVSFESNVTTFSTLLMIVIGRLFVHYDMTVVHVKGHVASGTAKIVDDKLSTPPRRVLAVQNATASINGNCTKHYNVL